MNPYYILIALSLMVVVSYLFNLIASFLKIPSVILLLSSGVLLHYLFNEELADFKETDLLLELLGIIGLILIVLEGSLDLKIAKNKIPLITRSLISATSVLVITSGIITIILNYFLSMGWKESVIYSVPLGVVSSAIAIPSVQKLLPEKREFIIYESTFSDIIGIMIFNYVILSEPFSAQSVGGFFIGIVSIIIISGLSSLLLLFMLNYATAHVKFFLVFAILIAIYSISKFFHLPSLLLILVFGLMINNSELFVKGWLSKYLKVDNLKKVVIELKLITAESAFIIRTFFFILFGYSIQISTLADQNVILIGSLIILTILLVRFILLRSISQKNVFPEIFIAPRGLITIVLFYSIPVHFQSPLFNDGILFFVIILSALIMMIGLISAKTEYSQEMENIGH